SRKLLREIVELGAQLFHPAATLIVSRWRHHFRSLVQEASKLIDFFPWTRFRRIHLGQRPPHLPIFLAVVGSGVREGLHEAFHLVAPSARLLEEFHAAQLYFQCLKCLLRHLGASRHFALKRMPRRVVATSCFFHQRPI